MNTRQELREFAERAAKVWSTYRVEGRIELDGDDAPLATAMKLHTNWYEIWDALAAGKITDDTLAVLDHIKRDACVINHVTTGFPEDIRSLYDRLIEKRYAELHAIHTIQVALAEETCRCVEDGKPFDVSRYIELAP